MTNKLILTLFLLGAMIFTNAGCTAAVIAGVAATGGYIAHEKGYRVRNPITKTDNRQKQ